MTLTAQSQIMEIDDSSKIHVLRAKFLSQNQSNVRIGSTYQYFLKNVDPIFSELISKILIIRPNNISVFLKAYFSNLKSSQPFQWTESSSSSSNAIDHKVYFSQYVSPIVADLIKKAAIAKPSNIADFLYAECSKEDKSSKDSVFADIAPSSSSQSLVKSKPLPSDSKKKELITSNNVNTTTAAANTTTNTQLDDNITPRRASTRSKLEDAKLLAQNLNASQAIVKPSIARNKIEDAINYEVNIQNDAELSASLNHKGLMTEIHPIPAVPAILSPKKNVQTVIPNQPSVEEVKAIQIALLGLNGGGKTSIINLLQGITDVPKPTVGFRPVSLMYGETKIQFYDLGGGDKIKGIWPQYYHDIHSVIYVIDVSSNEEGIQKSIDTFDLVISNPYIKNKPILVFLNKVDLITPSDSGNVESVIANVKQMVHNKINVLYQGDASAMVTIIPCSALPPVVTSEGPNYSPRIEKLSDIETNLELLFSDIKSNYKVINQRVQTDIQAKLKEESMKRLEKEIKVLKSKMCLALSSEIDLSIVVDILQLANIENETINLSIIEGDKNSKDVFEMEEGLEFLASEIDLTVDTLPPSAMKIAELVGYQRFALQIIGGMKVPTNKKRIALSWEEIYDIIIGLRTQLGLLTE